MRDVLRGHELQYVLNLIIKVSESHASLRSSRWGRKRARVPMRHRLQRLRTPTFRARFKLFYAMFVFRGCFIRHY
jgi:hypothetical protein